VTVGELPAGETVLAWEALHALRSHPLTWTPRGSRRPTA
jgi:hypothetical protein